MFLDKLFNNTENRSISQKYGPSFLTYKMGITHLTSVLRKFKGMTYSKHLALCLLLSQSIDDNHTYLARGHNPSSQFLFHDHTQKQVALTVLLPKPISK